MMTPVKYYSSSLLNDTPFLVSSSPSHYVKQKRDFFQTIYIILFSALLSYFNLPEWLVAVGMLLFFPVHIRDGT